MAAVHGKGSLFKLDNAAGVLTDISTYVTSVGLDMPIDEAETTTLGQNNKTFIQGLKSGTISLECNYDATFDAFLNGIEFLTGTFNYLPAGAAGVVYSGECFITSIGMPTSVGDVVKISVALRITGAVGRV